LWHSAPRRREAAADRDLRRLYGQRGQKHSREKVNMLKLTKATLVALTLIAPLAAEAAQTKPMACSVTVSYTLNSVQQLSYVRDFVVDVDAPYSEDFSTATRFRFFDAFLSYDGNTPVVSIVFDADVSVFNAVGFNADLKVLDETKGDSTSGNSAFFSSVPGAAGAHRTNYLLICARAR
jgi:hypothetical protein